MILVQLTGLSGAGKTTLATSTKKQLEYLGYNVEIIDGDEYRKSLCKDLGYSKEDRYENMRRLGFVGLKLVNYNIIVIIAAINPYEEVRSELKKISNLVKTVWIDCDLETLRCRDTKGLYYRAYLPINHENKIYNLSGVNDPFEIPQNVDFVINTNESNVEDSAKKLLDFILSNINHDKSS